MPKLKKGFVFIEESSYSGGTDEANANVDEREEYLGINTASNGSGNGGGRKRASRGEYVPGAYADGPVKVTSNAVSLSSYKRKKDLLAGISKDAVIADGKSVRKFTRQPTKFGDMILFKWVPDKERDDGEKIKDNRPERKQKYKRRSRSAYNLVEAMNAKQKEGGGVATGAPTTSSTTSAATSSATTSTATSSATTTTVTTATTATATAATSSATTATTATTSVVGNTALSDPDADAYTAPPAARVGGEE